MEGRIAQRWFTTTGAAPLARIAAGAFCAELNACRTAASNLLEGVPCCADVGWAPECRSNLECKAASDTCLCPNDPLDKWCTASNACMTMAPVPASRLAAGATCCWSTQCVGVMTCLANNKCGCATGEQLHMGGCGNSGWAWQAVQLQGLSAGQGVRPFVIWAGAHLGSHPPIAVAGTYCPALDSCRTPQSISDTSSTCCPTNAPWTADECAGAMTCDDTTNKCKCPANQDWCPAAGDCVDKQVVDENGACSCSLQCKGTMTCQSSQCKCPSDPAVKWCPATSTCLAVDAFTEGDSCSCALECKGDMTCDAGQCKCLPSTQDFCAAANSNAGACLTIDAITANGACTCDFQCDGSMTCQGGLCKCLDPSQKWCIATRTCMMPFDPNSQTEDVACCPDTNWLANSADECKGSMTCSTSTMPPSCQCQPANPTETWCASTNSCQAAGGCSCPVGSGTRGWWGAAIPVLIAGQRAVR